MANAVVIGNNHYNTLGVVRSLGENGINVYLIKTDAKKGFVEKSKYVTQTMYISEHEEQILDAVNAFCKNKERYYVIPTTDFSALCMDKFYKEFPENVIIPNMGGNMLQYQDKAIVKEIAAENGITVPCGMVVDLFDISQAEKWDCFGAIVKPVKSIEGKKSDIECAENKEELETVLNKFKNNGYEKALLEEFVGGETEHMIEIMGVCHKGDIEIAGIIKKFREFPIKNGSTAYAEIVDRHPCVDLNKITNFLKCFDFTGIFDLEMKCVGDKAYFIECNFRNGAPAYVFTKIGKNIPCMWIEKFEKIQGKKKKTSKKRVFMCEHIDMINMLKREVGVWCWIKQYIPAIKVFNKLSDPMPTIYYFIEMFGLLVKR